MGFLFGLIIGGALFGYIGFRYHAAIQDWLDMGGD